MNPTTVMLVIAIVMPGRQPDVMHRLEEPSIEQCWKDAKEFIAHGTPEATKDAIGVSASCFVPKEPTT